MEVIEPDDVYTSDAANSRAVVHGDTVYLSGVLGIDSDTGEYGADLGEQTRHALENARRSLEACGSSLDRIVRTIAYVTDLDRRAELDAAYREVLDEPYPARAAVEAGLADEEALVEIVVTAAR